MIEVFISYAREDEAHAKKLFQVLEKNGYRPWMDKMNLLPGTDWQREIEQAVSKSDVQVFLLSPRSVGKRGVFQREIRVALKKTEEMLESDISVIPMRLEPCSVPESLKKFQWLNCFEKGWENSLLKALYFAAEQRGIVASKSANQPLVVEYSTHEEIIIGGLAHVEYTLPKIEIPSNTQLETMISSIIKGQSSDLILDFKRRAEENKEHATEEFPHQFQFNSEVHFMDSNIISCVSSIYGFTGGVHGYGYTQSLNISLSEGSKFSADDLLVSAEFIRELIAEEARSTGEEPLATGYEIDKVVHSALRTNTSISDIGLIISFNQYELFCYAHGPVIFEVDWDAPGLQDDKLTNFGQSLKQLLRKQPQQT